MTTALDERWQAEQRDLRVASVRDIVGLWPLLDLSDLRSTILPWATAVATRVGARRTAGTQLALDYLAASRRQAGVAGDLRPVLTPDVDPDRFLTMMRATTVRAAGLAVQAPGTPLARQAADAALVRTAGAASRLVLEAGRQTVRETVAADPAAAGWARQTSGSPCDFCTMLASRGGVYKESTADFRAHDNCACVPRVVWRTARSR